MEGCRTEHVDSCRHPGTAGMAPPPTQPFGTAPRHLLAGCREMGLKIGKLGLSGQRERQAGCHIGRCRKQPDIQLPGIAYPPSTPKLRQHNHKNPSILPQAHGTITGSWPNPFQGCGTGMVFHQDIIPSSSAGNPCWRVTTTAVPDPA